MTSVHLRRLQHRRIRTADRLLAHADARGLALADLRDVALPWYAIRTHADPSADGAEGFAEVFIFDEIGGSFGITADEFIDDLNAITAPEIRVRINSPGGVATEAVAIHNALLHHPAQVVVYVDSLAASAASVIAMAGDEIVMMPGSQMMIHDASVLLDGNAADMRAAATFLDRQSDNIADMYRMRGGGEVAEWRELMLAETWMFARETVEMGLADRVHERERVEQEADDDEMELAMGRSFDLSVFRYPGRAHAPAPPRRRAVEPAPTRVGAGRRGVKAPPAPPPVESDERGTQFTRAYTEEAAGILGEPMGSPIPFAASTPGVKRDGLDLRASGWLVDNFRRNPVVLWAHNHTAPPIGRADPQVRHDQLRMAVVFDQDDPFAVRLESKYRRGFLHAVSIGWDFVNSAGQPLNWSRLTAEQIRDQAFYDVTELSSVPVPSDPDALMERQRSALRHLSRELSTLFDDMNRPDSDSTAPQIQQALLDECVRLGIPLDLDHWRPRDQPAAGPDSNDHPPAAAGVDHEAARSVLAAFNLQGVGA